MIVRHRVEARGVLPDIRAHNLVVDPVWQQLRTRPVLQLPVEELETEVLDVDQRYRIELQAGERGEDVANQADHADLRAEVVIWAEQQVIIGLGVVLRVLSEVVDGGAGSATVVARGLQNGDVNPRKLLFEGDHLLPIAVITWVRYQLVEDGIGFAVDLVEITVGAAAGI